jgi:hypothetical protein
MGFRVSTAVASAGSRCRTWSSAGDCWRMAGCWPRRRTPIAPRRFCAASGCSTTSSDFPYRLRHRVSTPISPRPSPVPCHRRSASGWRSTARIRRATVVIPRSIRWGSRWRISMSSADGGPLMNRAIRSIRSGRQPAACRSTGCVACEPSSSSGPSSFLEPSPKSFWHSHSDALSTTTTGQRCERSSATRRSKTIAGRRSYWES